MHILWALVQGISEGWPVSSSAHILLWQKIEAYIIHRHHLASTITDSHERECLLHLGSFIAMIYAMRKSWWYIIKNTYEHLHLWLKICTTSINTKSTQPFLQKTTQTKPWILLTMSTWPVMCVGLCMKIWDVRPLITTASLAGIFGIIFSIFFTHSLLHAQKLQHISRHQTNTTWIHQTHISSQQHQRSAYGEFFAFLSLTSQEEQEDLLLPQKIKRLNYKEALYVGLGQCCALLPGVSRLGICCTILCWMNIPIRHAIDYSFLMGGLCLSMPAVLSYATILPLLQHTWAWFLMIQTAIITYYSLCAFRTIGNHPLTIRSIALYRILLSCVLLYYAWFV